MQKEMDSKGKKRGRSVNFNWKETDRLIELVESKKSIIESKKSDAVTWYDKETAWMDIEIGFNSSMGYVFRDAKHLKLKYEALKRDTRKKLSTARAEREKTGGGTSTLTPAEERIKNILLSAVEGEESIYDQDQFSNPDNTDNFELEVNESGNSNFAEVDDFRDNLIVEIKEEPIEKKICLESNFPVARVKEVITAEKIETPKTQWDSWKTDNFKSKEHPALCQPKEKRSFDRLAEENLDTAALRKELLQEELKQKKIQRQMLEEDKEHKKQMHELEKQHMLFKIEILKIELQNAQKI